MESVSHRSRYITFAALFVVALVAGYFIVRARPHPPIDAAPADVSSNISSSTQLSGDVQGSPRVTGTALSSDSGLKTTLPEPSLTRVYTPPKDAPVDIQAADKKAVNDAIAQLKIDPNHLAYWLQLAIYRKNANDFAGAEEVWLYCVARWPTDGTAYNNLADLYGNYTHQYDKAVLYWKKLIAIQPTAAYAYANLATLYGINLHDAPDARTIVEAGLKVAPGDPQLLSLQSQYK